MGEGKTVEHWDAWTATMQAKHGNGNGHGKSLAIEAQRLLPTPRTPDTNGAGAHGTGGPDLRTVCALLPTPTVNDAGNVGGASQFDRNTVPLSHALLPTPLLPTPDAQMGNGGRVQSMESLSAGLRQEHMNDLPRLLELRGAEDTNRWGDYAPAVARWESVIGRPAPAPTEPGPKGSPRLSPAFVEWLMGLPAGHVTDVDIPRNAQLKCLGNGVVPAQAAAAAQWWLAQIQETVA